MNSTLEVLNTEGKLKPVLVELFPDRCPVCEFSVQPRYLGGTIATSTYPEDRLFLAFICPRASCRAIFTALYRQDGGTIRYMLLSSGVLRRTERQQFQDSVEEISSQFCKIYNEALTAEASGLIEIAGPGYRKALEFLVKDCALSLLAEGDEEQREAVEKKLLGPCIQDHIDDPKVKAMAQRAAWLGNDETHYRRDHSSFDLQDLKKLITLVTYWIDSEHLTGHYDTNLTSKRSPRQRRV